jgi:gluconokinase
MLLFWDEYPSHRGRSSMLLLVVMGVSGAGKTTVGQQLAWKLGAPFVDADDLHPAANKAKMKDGIALSDSDRQPWLESIAAVCNSYFDRNERAGISHIALVVACSALKKAYRQMLKQHCMSSRTSLLFLHLDISMPVALRRVQARSAHFFPASLLESQFGILEMPTGSEGLDVLSIVIDEDTSCEFVVDCALTYVVEHYWDPLAERVAQTVLQTFDALPVKGKPAAGEWTVCSGIVMRMSTSDSIKKKQGAEKEMEKEMEMEPGASMGKGETFSLAEERWVTLSLATGTKCLGLSEMVNNGTLVIDMHAEVLAIRLLRHLLLEHGLREGVVSLQHWLETGHFYFYTSQAPCGDATISQLPTRDGEEDQDQKKEKDAADKDKDKGNAKTNMSQGEKQQKKQEKEAETEAETHWEVRKRRRLSADVQRTGAKPWPGEPADPLQPGVHFHRLGILRRKPGRGSPSQSLSCSDKLWRHQQLGWEGAFLSQFLSEPLHMSAVVVGSHRANAAALTRALLERGQKPADLQRSHLHMLRLSHLATFPFAQNVIEQSLSVEATIVPCGAALTYVAYPIRWDDDRESKWPKVEVLVGNGRLLGWSHRKEAALPVESQRSLSRLCKWRLFQQGCQWLQQLNRPVPSTYQAMKQAAQEYQERKELFQRVHAPHWLSKSSQVDAFGRPTAKEADDEEQGKEQQRKKNRTDDHAI